MLGYFEDVILSSSAHWPGKNVTVVRFVGTDFNCPFGPARLEQGETYQRDLKELIRNIKKGLIYTDGLLLTGGEPLLQREAMLQITRAVKKNDVKIGLDTHGTKPALLELILKERLVDMIRFDYYSPFEPGLFEKITRSKTFFKTAEGIIYDVNESIQILKRHQQLLQIEFNTMIVPGLIYRKEDLITMGEMISDFDCIWTLKPFNPRAYKPLSRMYHEIRPPSNPFMQELAESLSNRFPRLQIEIESSNPSTN